MLVYLARDAPPSFLSRLSLLLHVAGNCNLLQGDLLATHAE